MNQHNLYRPPRPQDIHVQRWQREIDATLSADITEQLKFQSTPFKPELVIPNTLAAKKILESKTLCAKLTHNQDGSYKLDQGEKPIVRLSVAGKNLFDIARWGKQWHEFQALEILKFHPALKLLLPAKNSLFLDAPLGMIDPSSQRFVFQQINETVKQLRRQYHDKTTQSNVTAWNRTVRDESHAIRDLLEHITRKHDQFIAIHGILWLVKPWLEGMNCSSPPMLHKEIPAFLNHLQLGLKPAILLGYIAKLEPSINGDSHAQILLLFKRGVGPLPNLAPAIKAQWEERSGDTARKWASYPGSLESQNVTRKNEQQFEEFIATIAETFTYKDTYLRANHQEGTKILFLNRVEAGKTIDSLNF